MTQQRGSESRDDKNPYQSETPEYQLWALAASAEATQRTFTADAEKYIEKAEAARKKAERYRAALAKLDGNT